MTTSSKNKVTSFISLSILGVSSVLSLQAIASDAVGPGDDDSKWVLGGTVGALNNPYSGEGSEAQISPNIRYNGERFFIKDGSLNLNIAESHGFSGGLRVALGSGFLSDSSNYQDNENLTGLIEREETVFGGFYINHDTELGRLSFRALSDIGDEHDGHLANLKYTFDLKAGNWNINPVLGVEWLSEELVDHHVGVSFGEVTALREQYRGESTANAFIGVRARYDITENWDIDLNTGITKLGSGISNSSIIEDDVVYQASVGINYNF